MDFTTSLPTPSSTSSVEGYSSSTAAASAQDRKRLEANARFLSSYPDLPSFIESRLTAKGYRTRSDLVFGFMDHGKKEKHAQTLAKATVKGELVSSRDIPYVKTATCLALEELIGKIALDDLLAWKREQVSTADPTLFFQEHPAFPEEIKKTVLAKGLGTPQDLQCLLMEKGLNRTKAYAYVKDLLRGILFTKQSQEAKPNAVLQALYQALALDKIDGLEKYHSGKSARYEEMGREKERPLSDYPDLPPEALEAACQLKIKTRSQLVSFFVRKGCNEALAAYLTLTLLKGHLYNQHKADKEPTTGWRLLQSEALWQKKCRERETYKKTTLRAHNKGEEADETKNPVSLFFKDISTLPRLSSQEESSIEQAIAAERRRIVQKCLLLPAAVRHIAALYKKAAHTLTRQPMITITSPDRDFYYRGKLSSKRLNPEILIPVFRNIIASCEQLHTALGHPAPLRETTRKTERLRQHLCDQITVFYLKPPFWQEIEKELHDKNASAEGIRHAYKTYAESIRLSHRHIRFLEEKLVLSNIGLVPHFLTS